jgi:transglutaminase-like putative cysteine protease
MLERWRERWPERERPLRWVIAAFAAAVALHADRLPAWCLAAIAAIVLWRLFAAFASLDLPRRLIRLGLGAGLLLAVVAQFSTISGLAAGSSLLAAMGAVKLLETRERRDHYIVLGVSLFLMIAATLDRQDLPRIALYAAHLWLCCATLAIVGTPDTRLPARAAFALAGRTLAYALPLTLLLFLFFPRVQGQIWSLPAGGAAVTGLGDEMSPGSISQLSESDEPAFRVTFVGARPPSTSLYWRGPVLHQFDGYTWRRELGRVYRSARLDYEGPAYRYRVTLEPHRQRWWFALDLPVAPPRQGVFFTFDYQLVGAEPVTQAVSYELTSHIAYRSDEQASLLARRVDLQLPSGRNRRALDWAQRERARAGSDAAYVRRVLALFRDGGFVYSLTPPLLDLDSVDDFLFRTRTGFCGHYASAFATLMRAAGIPARVVTGYHGGEWNPIGQYLIVRQSDAHAWAEIWVDGRGWSRVDPTAVVAPDRLQRAALDRIVEAIGGADPLIAELGWWARTALTWDAINTWWKIRVLEFDLGSQLGLLRELGFERPALRQLGWLVAGGLAVWLLAIAARFGRAPRGPRGDALARGYRRLCARLARAGIAREPQEGPLDYAARVGRERPELAQRVVPALERYAAVRFGPDAAADEAGALARELRRLRP